MNKPHCQSPHVAYSPTVAEEPTCHAALFSQVNTVLDWAFDMKPTRCSISPIPLVLPLLQPSAYSGPAKSTRTTHHQDCMHSHPQTPCFLEISTQPSYSGCHLGRSPILLNTNKHATLDFEKNGTRTFCEIYLELINIIPKLRTTEIIISNKQA